MKISKDSFNKFTNLMIYEGEDPKGKGVNINLLTSTNMLPPGQILPPKITIGLLRKFKLLGTLINIREKLESPEELIFHLPPKEIQCFLMLLSSPLWRAFIYNKNYKEIPHHLFPKYFDKNIIGMFQTRYYDMGKNIMPTFGSEIMLKKYEVDTIHIKDFSPIDLLEYTFVSLIQYFTASSMPLDLWNFLFLSSEDTLWIKDGPQSEELSFILKELKISITEEPKVHSSPDFIFYKIFLYPDQIKLSILNILKYWDHTTQLIDFTLKEEFLYPVIRDSPDFKKYILPKKKK